jgi:hypothetical protein
MGFEPRFQQLSSLEKSLALMEFLVWNDLNPNSTDSVKTVIIGLELSGPFDTFVTG